ncbi:MAG: winged helix-turn-helix transcriptional regulator [Candidatus Helarchaeales archaeon]
MAKRSSETQFKILNLLEKEDLGLTVTQIAEKIGLNRNSTAKYLEIMAEKDLIYKVERGPTAKLFYPQRKSKSFEERANYMVRFYQLLHSVFFKDYLRDPKKAQEIGYEMAKRGATDIYTKQFDGFEFTFENITQLAAIAVEITYPIPNVKAQVHINQENSHKSFLLTIENCICEGNSDYKSICDIQAGLLKGIIENLIAPTKVEVKEIECRCDGSDNCTYLIQQVK